MDHLCAIFSRPGATIPSSPATFPALKALDELKPSLVLDGGPADDPAFLDQIREHNGDLSVVPLEKPVDPSKLRLLLDRALELNLARQENERLAANFRIAERLANSSATLRLFARSTR